MIKAAFFDVDGTLLSHNTASVPVSAREALDQLEQQGILRLIASGRHMSELEDLPGADIAFDGYITLNGQLTLNREKKVIAGHPFTREEKEPLLRLFEERKIPVLLVEEEKRYINFLNEEVVEAQARISSEPPVVGTYGGAELYQVVVYCPKGEEEYLQELVPGCIITRWSPFAVDIIAAGSGKAEGIREYLQKTHIAPEEVIAFGDGENDVDMLKFAGIGVAMGNAEEAVKAAADYVTDAVEADGIAKALKHFGLIG